MSKLLRNSSPGALTRAQAEAVVKKRAVQYRQQAQEARELAAQGRGGDTEVAHVTLGEIVLPPALQTAAVLAALRQAATEANISLDRLRIGSPANSINPETGLPEFAYPGLTPEDPRNPRVQGQQVADIYVNRFDSGFFPNVGHAGIGVNTPQTQGFYSRDHEVRGPGVVKNDDLSLPHDTVRIKTTPEEDAAVQAYIDKRQSNPGNYNLFLRNCTDFVGEALRAGKVPVPSDSTPNPYDDFVPNMFFPTLRRQYGP